MGLLFIAFCGGMIAAAVYGWYFGNPRLLVVGWDTDQFGCGYSNGTTEFPYLYWPVPPTTSQVTQISNGNVLAAVSLLSKGVCVKSCPKGNSDDPVICRPTSILAADYHFSNCTYYPMAQSYAGQTVLGAGFRYETISLLGSYCIPKGADYVDAKTYEAFKTSIFSSVYGNAAASYFHDIAATWSVLLIAAIVTVILSYLYLFVIRLVGGFIIVLAFLSAIIICAGGGFYSYFYARPTYDPANPVYNYLAYAAYVCWGLAGLIVFSIICCYDAIKIGIAVFKTTSQYVQNNMQIFALPFISTL